MDVDCNDQKAISVFMFVLELVVTRNVCKIRKRKTEARGHLYFSVHFPNKI